VDIRLYGAGPLKLGTVIYEDMTEERRMALNVKYPAGDAREKSLKSLGLRAKRRIEEGLPALGAVQKQVAAAARKGYLKTIDGGRLKVRSAHAALNTLLQGGGAVLMKKALVMFVDELGLNGWRLEDPLTGVLRGPAGEYLGFVANIHDEVQMEVDAPIAEYVGKAFARAITEAGVALGLRCPMAGAYQVGDTWADSH
jgi:DNA polymerase I